jgi:hypothetical protein
VPSINYKEQIRSLLASTVGPIDIEEIYQLFDVSATTVKKHLRAFLEENLEAIPRVIGFYPSAEAIISLAEQRAGDATPENLFAVNLECKSIVDSITKPKHQKFINALFAEFIESDGATIRIPSRNLLELLYEDYVKFVHETDNGVVSIAGALNEGILIRGLTRAGLILGESLKKTGKDSEGDLQIEHRGRTTKIMFCEVKSYAARERLLRGLQDIRQPFKIGVGFFNNPSEFNPDRTRTLLAADPSAIYMPDGTLARLSEASATQTTRNQDRLYRPLSSFVPDMVAFSASGNLPER